MYTCEICGKTFEKRKSYIGHHSHHGRIGYSRTSNSVLNKVHIGSCKYCGKEVQGRALGGHVASCDKNPNIADKIQKISKSHIGKTMSNENKQKVSAGMIKAHKEGRAWNIGKSRWNNEQSWPEKFFESVIQNEFIDKNYRTEYTFSIYSFDFAWPDKKRVIEIDGKQHTYPEYRERDKRKDKLAIESGWEIMRISWNDMFNDTKNMIAKAYKFIHK